MKRCCKRCSNICLRNSTSIDEKLQFFVEIYAPKNAISTSSDQENGLDTYFSQMLKKCELCQSSVENEAAAIVEAGHKVAVDQRLVAFM